MAVTNRKRAGLPREKLLYIRSKRRRGIEYRTDQGGESSTWKFEWNRIHSILMVTYMYVGVLKLICVCGASLVRQRERRSDTVARRWIEAKG